MLLIRPGSFPLKIALSLELQTTDFSYAPKNPANRSS